MSVPYLVHLTRLKAFSCLSSRYSFLWQATWRQVVLQTTWLISFSRRLTYLSKGMKSACRLSLQNNCALINGSGSLYRVRLLSFRNNAVLFLRAQNLNAFISFQQKAERNRNTKQLTNPLKLWKGLSICERKCLIQIWFRNKLLVSRLNSKNDWYYSFQDLVSALPPSIPLRLKEYKIKIVLVFYKAICAGPRPDKVVGDTKFW